MYFTYAFESGIITLNQRMECDNMERLNVLTADCGAFYLRYLLDCGRITVEKYINGVLSDSSAVETLLPETKAQKLLLMLFAARVTPVVLEEMAEDMEV